MVDRRRRWTIRLSIANSLVAVGVMVILVLATRPVGPVQVPISGASPGTSFYPIGSGDGLAVGVIAPDFTGDPSDDASRLKDLGGEAVSIADYRGSPLWVVFWASWCPPCQQEMPDIKALATERAADGLKVLAISIQEPEADARAYTERFSLPFRVASDLTGSVAQAYGVFGLPSHYFISRDGEIVDRGFGQLDRASMELRLAKIIGDGPP
jgi:peroxiredoxin